MNFFHKLIAGVGFLSLASLAACSTTAQSQATAAIEAVYTVDASVANQYKTGALGIAPSADVVAEIQAVDNLAKPRIDAIRTAARNGQALTVAEQIAATDAVNELSALLQKLGLLKSNSVKLLPEPK